MYCIYVMESGTGKEVELVFDTSEKAEKIFLENVGHGKSITDGLGVVHESLDTAFGFSTEKGYMNLDKLQKMFGVWKKKDR